MLEVFFRLARWNFIRRFFCALLLVLVVGSFPVAASAQATIGILPFKNSSGHHGLEQVMMTSLVSLLTDTPCLTLIDRLNLKDILAEQVFKKSSLSSKNVTQSLLMGGMDYLLTGTILDVQNISANKEHKKPVTQVTVFWKLLDTLTGRVVCADTLRTSVEKILVKQDGKKLWMMQPDALSTALQKVAGNICGELQTKLKASSVLAHIASIDGDTVYLDSGTDKGINLGQVFSIYQDGKLVRNPLSGNVLGQQRKLLCQILIDRVEKGLASGKLLEGSADELQVGDTAEVRR